MDLYVFILISWFGCIVTCYYIIRPITNKLIRIFLTTFFCTLLSCISCKNLPELKAFSLVIVAICWLTSIRLIHLTVFSGRLSLTFQSYLIKILWIYFPILPKKSAKYQWSIILHLILILIKILINNWSYRWLINCDTRINFERIFIFFLFLITLLYILDVQIILVRILTGDKYTLECFCNFPLLSLSVREFWGQRYNRFVHICLKESIFEPIQLEFSSSSIGGLITFIISGLLHVHIGFIVINDTSCLFQIFAFFVLHGIVCCLEANIKIQFLEHVAWLITHAFLIITAPLLLEPFIKEGSSFLMFNPPPLLNVKWIPQLPLPNFCSQ